MTDSYDLVYNWFDVLLKKKHQIAGYVIMPNHVHALIALNNSNQSINTILANGKRFIAYEIITRLQNAGFYKIIDMLSNDLSDVEKNKGQLHKYLGQAAISSFAIRKNSLRRS